MEGSVWREGEFGFCLDSYKNDKVSDTENPSPPFASSTDEKRVRFSRTQIYYFIRQQGHSSVPQRGGCSLGMAQTHFHSETYNALQYRRIRRMERKLVSNSLAGPTHTYARGRRRKLNFARMPLVPVEDSFNPGDARRIPDFYSPPHLSPQDEANDSEVLSTIADCAPTPPCLSPPIDPFNPEFDSLISIEVDPETSFDTAFSTGVEKKLLPLHPAVRSRLLRRAGKYNIISLQSHMYRIFKT